MSNARCSIHRSDAFPLIELLVVIVIIGVLTALALPVYSQVMVKSRQTTTLSNMKQVGAAFLLYAGDNNNRLPDRVISGAKWPSLLSTYVQNLHVYNSPIPDYVGTADQVTDPTKLVSDSYNYTDYIANGYGDTTQYGSVAPVLSNISTPTQVILLGIQKPHANNFYMDFYERNEVSVVDKAPQGAGGSSAWAGAVYVFCDGSAKFLTDYPAGDTSAGTTTAPPNGSCYTDWLWLINKNSQTN